jgi:hypothetical protein
MMERRRIFALIALFGWSGKFDINQPCEVFLSQAADAVA